MMKSEDEKLDEKISNFHSSEDDEIDLSDSEIDEVYVKVESYTDDLINKEMEEDGFEWDYELDGKTLQSVLDKLN